MTDQFSPPVARLTVITLGVSDMRVSIGFYEALGFARKFRATGEEVAFFETGGTVLGLYRWSKLALDAQLPDQPRPAAFRGATLAWNCRTTAEVDTVLAFAQRLQPSKTVAGPVAARGCVHVQTGASGVSPGGRGA